MIVKLTLSNYSESYFSYSALKDMKPIATGVEALEGRTVKMFSN